MWILLCAIFLERPPLNPVKEIVFNDIFLATFIALIIFFDLPDELIVIKISDDFPICLIWSLKTYSYFRSLDMAVINGPFEAKLITKGLRPFTSLRIFWWSHAKWSANAADPPFPQTITFVFLFLYALSNTEIIFFKLDKFIDKNDFCNSK